jgi:hypothetical protein
MKFKGIAIFFFKNTPKKQIQCNKSREGDPLTLLGHPLFAFSIYILIQEFNLVPIAGFCSGSLIGIPETYT